MLKAIVTTIGNTLVARGITRPVAFKRAWCMSRTKFFTKAVGVTVGNRQEALRRLARYGKELVRVYLVHESNNPADSNAVAVVVAVVGKGEYKVGYIKADKATMLARVIDKIGGRLEAALESVTGGGGFKRYGLNISYAFGAA